MAYSFPEGAKLYFSTTFAAAKTLATMSNANPTVAGSVAHGYVDNDEILLTSGWEDATDTVYKVDQLTVDTFSPLGLDTTNTGFFAAGAGANSTAQKISSWLEIPQVLTLQPQGGGPRFTTITPLAKRNAINVPTGFEASSLNLTLGYDPALANFQTMLNISRSLTKCAFKLQLAGTGAMYGYGYLSVSEVPQLANGQANQVQASMTFLGRPMSYA